MSVGSFSSSDLREEWVLPSKILDPRIFSPGYKADVAVPRPKTELKNVNLIIGANLCMLIVVLNGLTLLPSLSSSISIGETDNVKFTFTKNENSGQSEYQKTYERGTMLVYVTVISTALGFIFSELYVRFKGVPSRYRCVSYKHYQCEALTFMSLAFIGSVCLVGCAVGSITFIPKSWQIPLNAGSDIQIKPGKALGLLIAALCLLCLSFAWYVWRVHGDASSYPFCGTCNGRGSPHVQPGIDEKGLVSRSDTSLSSSGGSISSGESYPYNGSDEKV